MIFSLQNHISILNFFKHFDTFLKTLQDFLYKHNR